MGRWWAEKQSALYHYRARPPELEGQKVARPSINIEMFIYLLKLMARMVCIAYRPSVQIEVNQISLICPIKA